MKMLLTARPISEFCKQIQTLQLLNPWVGGSNAFAATKSAWKNPSIEIDEDYWGTYHIEKNMTLEVPYHLIQKYRRLAALLLRRLRRHEHYG